MNLFKDFPIEVALLAPIFESGAGCIQEIEEIEMLGFSDDCFASKICCEIWKVVLQLKADNKLSQAFLLEFCKDKDSLGSDFSDRSVNLFDIVSCKSLKSEMITCAKHLMARRIKEKWAESAKEIGSAWDHPHITPSEVMEDIQTHLADVQGMLPSGNLLAQACEELKEEAISAEKGETVRGIQSGVEIWDASFAGLLDELLYIVAGRPGAGKTSLSEQIIDNLLTNGEPVLYIQKELSPYRAVGRIAAKRAGIPWSKFERKEASKEDWAKLNYQVLKIEKQPLYLERASNCTPNSIQSLILHYSRHYGIKLVVYDYLQLIAPKSGQEKRIVIANLVASMKDAANDCGVPIIALAQLSRDTERKSSKPLLSDLKESGDIEQAADVVVALWKTDTEEMESQPRYPVNWSILKSRNSQLGTTQVLFDGPTMSFKGKMHSNLI